MSNSKRKTNAPAPAVKVAPEVVAPAVNVAPEVVAPAVNVAPVMGAPMSFHVAGYANNPPRVLASPTGKGDALVCRADSFAVLPSSGVAGMGPRTTLTLRATDTEVPGHTLHYAARVGVGHAYRQPGRKDTWILRGAALPWLGDNPPAMLHVDAPLRGAVTANTVPLTAPVQLRSAHGLLISIPVVPVAPDAPTAD